MLEFLDTNHDKHLPEGPFWIRCGKEYLYCTSGNPMIARDSEASIYTTLTPLSPEIVLARLEYLGLTIEEFISATEGL